MKYRDGILTIPVMFIIFAIENHNFKCEEKKTLSCLSKFVLCK
jgi:hypothetical protein